MKWIGLTGGIASGKSTAKKLFESLGAASIDADQVAHQVSALGSQGYDQVVSHFGHSFLQADKNLDRKKLATLIFSNSEQRLKLENILHPLIKVEVQKLKAVYQAAGASICIYDVPLLFEKNLGSQFDSSVLVWCDPNQQLNRLMARNQLTQAEAQSRIDVQLRMIEKVKRADHCLDNSTGLDNLKVQIVHLAQALALSSKKTVST